MWIGRKWMDRKRKNNGWYSSRGLYVENLDIVEISPLFILSGDLNKLSSLSIMYVIPRPPQALYPENNFVPRFAMLRHLNFSWL